MHVNVQRNASGSLHNTLYRRGSGTLGCKFWTERRLTFAKGQLVGWQVVWYLFPDVSASLMGLHGAPIFSCQQQNVRPLVLKLPCYISCVPVCTRAAMRSSEGSPRKTVRLPLKLSRGRLKEESVFSWQWDTGRISQSPLSIPRSQGRSLCPKACIKITMKRQYFSAFVVLSATQADERLWMEVLH